jgi:peptide/nickel transport system permease protein
MRRYVIKRLLLGLVTILGVSIIIFVLSRSTGDVTHLYAPENATEEELAVIRTSLGLDKPIPVQYLIFINNILHGDFGTSIAYQGPVITVILHRLPATIELGVAAFIVGNFFGLLLGIISATKRGSWFDVTSRTFAMLGQAIPGFWTAVMLVMIFAVYLHWLPTSGMGGIKHLILPVFSLSWFSIAFVMRITRSALLDVLGTDYVKFARIKGVPERWVIIKHALRNSLIPVVTMMGMQLATLVGGSVFIETIFRWPGMGQLMINSISSGDYPLVQAITLLVGSMIVVVNLLVDIMYVYLDPRIKYE